MPNYDPELQTHFRLWLDGEEVPFPEGSARFVNGTIDPIDEAVSSRRTVNGTLRIQADPAFRKFRLTVSCTDSMLPALFGIDPRQVATVWSPVVVRERGNTPSRTPVPGSLVSEGDWIEYRPILTGYLTSIPSLSEPEWQSDANWSLVFEESNVPTVYFVTMADAELATVASGGSLTFNVGVLAATNTGLPITFARVSGSLPPGTSLNASTGVISGTPTTAGLYTFTIRATSGGQTGEQTYSILVNAASAPRVNFAAVAQQDYTPGTYLGLNLAPSVTVENSSGVPVFDIQGGSLPPGLTLSTSGVVFGTPTGYGPYAAQIRAIIPSGEFDIQTIVFDAAVPTIVSSGVALQDFTVGTAFSFDMTALVTVTGTSVAPTFTADVGSLPAGLSMSSTGVISGTPTGYGAYAFTARATLPSGQWTEVSVALFQQNPDELPDAAISGGTAQTWTESAASGSTTYDACDFTASGVLTVLSAGWLEYILVAGGAGGASVSSTAGGGGGGAGGFRRERIYLPAGNYSVSVGGGGGAGVSGSTTSLTDEPTLTRSIFGGGRGATGTGGYGSSGGGGGGSATTGGTGGNAMDASFGSSGAAGSGTSTASLQFGGGGGGYSSAGFSGSSSARPHGGGGIKVRLWATLEFCGGGGGGSGNGGTGPGSGVNGAGNGGASGANGSSATANSGSGGGGAGGGSSGTRTGGSGGSGRAIFIVRRRTA